MLWCSADACIRTICGLPDFGVDVPEQLLKHGFDYREAHGVPGGLYFSVSVTRQNVSRVVDSLASESLAGGETPAP